MCGVYADNTNPNAQLSAQSLAALPTQQVVEIYSSTVLDLVQSKYCGGGSSSIPTSTPDPMPSTSTTSATATGSTTTDSATTTATASAQAGMVLAERCQQSWLAAMFVVVGFFYGVAW